MLGMQTVCYRWLVLGRLCMDKIDREYYESFDWFWKDYDNKKENEQCQKDTNVTNVEKS
jgi:hypothetical protein